MAPAAGNHSGWDLLLASCRAVFRIGVSAPVLLWGLACLLAPCLLEQLSSRQPKTHDARHPAKEDLAHAQATASCLAQQRLLVSYLLPLPPSYTNTKQLATSKHQMWWLATEMTDDGNRLLSRREELQLGCPAPGSVTGALSRGAKARIEGPPTDFGPGARRAF